MMNEAGFLVGQVPMSAVNVLRTIVYVFHCRIATAWKRGNIFIAGDAAHCQPPFNGQGMNRYVEDSANVLHNSDQSL